MTTHYRVWTVGDNPPEWAHIELEAVVRLAPDCWRVSVAGNGSDLVKFLKSRRDVFICYLRVSE